MKQELKEINLAISFDQGYVPFVYVLLTSIFYNNTDVQIVIHVIAPEISIDDKENIGGFVRKKGGIIHFYSLSPSATNGFALPNHENSYFTLANYYRLFFADLVPSGIDKLLYLDIDTLVIGSLKKLFQINLEAFAIGAVHDVEMHLRSDLGLSALDEYFNSGVLLINLPEWRAQNITRRACDIASKYPDKVKGWVDQDALNMLLQGDWHRLDWQYNVMNGFIPYDLPYRHFKNFLADKFIIHYNGAPKPWNWACENKFRFLYKEYAKKSSSYLTQSYITGGKPRQGYIKLFKNRALEIYFNYPEIGKAWRNIKSAIKR